MQKMNLRTGQSPSPNNQPHMLAGAGCQRDQHIQAEFIPFAAHQAGYAGLPDTQFSAASCCV